MNKQQLQQEIAELQKQLEEKQKTLSAMPDKWEPKGGDFVVDFNGCVSRAPTADDTRVFGTKYKTREQAEKASKAMRTHNRLLAYVAEFAPDWEADWMDGDQQKVSVIYIHADQAYSIISAYREQRLGCVFMPHHVAIELCKKLNSGEVEL